MKYKYNGLTLISKFTIHDYFFQNNHSLSSIFWNTIFDYDYFWEFINKKYIPLQLNENKITKSNIENIKFLLKKLKTIKKQIDMVNNPTIKAEDLFFSYILFSKILDLYNQYYASSNVKISLLKGLVFNYNRDQLLDNILSDIENKFIQKNEFFDEFLQKICIEKSIFQDNQVYVLKIFWPDEIVTLLALGKILKENTKNSKILLNISEANEQFDYTQWRDFIKEKTSFLSQYIDYVVLYKDFWYSINHLVESLNANNWIKLTNIVDISQGEFNESPFEKENIENPLDKFIDNIHQWYMTQKLFWKKWTNWRLFPYKCYWSKCNFCTINSQNSLTFDTNYKYDTFIDNRIEYIKKENISCVVFWDEAISPAQIVNFANRIIENNIKIIYQFRTRFDKAYTKEVCELLYKSWARYCGIWLESASARINEEIGNKWEKHISLQDKLKIIHNFDTSGVGFHNYAIMWFPTETKLETVATYSFLLQNINNSHYYTTTPNTFSLMKGSYIFDNLDKYAIEVNENYKNNLLNLNYEFSYSNWEERNVQLYNNLAEKIHIEQFLPWLKWNQDFSSEYSAKEFWDYIDRSSYFYKMKMIYRDNPYIWFMNKNNQILNQDLLQNMKTQFSLSSWLQITVTEKNTLYIYDWVNFVWLFLDEKYKDFLTHYDADISLWENLQKISWDYTNEDIFFLLKNRILTIKD